MKKIEKQQQIPLCRLFEVVKMDMKSFVIGRKAWLFADTPSGAEASAIVYSMVEMAKENGLNIHSYLNFLLKKRPSDNMSDEELEQLAPWGAAAVLECSNKK